MFIIFLIIFALFTGLMYFYHLERMSMIYKRLKIRVILYHQTICRIMLRAHLYLWKMNVFLNIMDSISKGQHVHYFQRLVNVSTRREHHYSTNCKNYYYNNERSFTRKLKELFVAHKVEQQYSKNQILSFYLNNIYYGNNQYDIESAANYYFGATTNQNNSSYPIITVLQSAMLASKVNAPSVYDINNVSNNFKNRIKVNLEK